MLFLVHHADAADAVIDPQRPLTDRGHDDARNLADRAQRRAVRPAAIWHSGKLRTRQTAEYFWRACNPLAELAATRHLQPTDPPQWIADAVAGEPRDIMLVGHMPHMARLLELLTAPGETAGFPPHGLVALQKHDRGWIEVWRESPGAGE